MPRNELILGDALSRIVEDADIVSAPTEFIAGVTFRYNGSPFFFEGKELREFRERQPSNVTDIVYHWDHDRIARMAKIRFNYLMATAYALLD